MRFAGNQGGRSCAEKFGLGRKYQALTYPVLSRFTHFFFKSLEKRSALGSKTVFLGQEVHYYMVYIAYNAEIELSLSRLSDQH